MIGTTLTRYAETPFLVWDLEAENLNLAFSRPWQLAYGIATLKGGLQSVRSVMIRWPNLRMTEDNPSFRHFDRARYDREAKDPAAVWAEFEPVLYGGQYRSVGHNLLGYDEAIISVWRRGIGLRPDEAWLYAPPLLDTLCVAKSYRASWTPDVSSPEAFVAWQYRALHTRLAKGVKTKLGIMCAEFGIEYDEARAHEAQYDIERNWLVAQALVWKVEC